MDLGKYINESLREVALGNDVLAESKSVDGWWDRLPGKRRAKVVSILGMSKGKDKQSFDNLDADEQAEITAYFNKHKGRVESVNIERTGLEEAVVVGNPYSTLNDAAKRTFNPAYKKGRTQIWYMTRKGWDSRRTTGMRFFDSNKNVPRPTAEFLNKDGDGGHYALLGEIAETNKDQIFMMMQGEMWSPNGEARSLIRKKGLVHTSMSVGDLIKIGNKLWLVNSAGFEDLGSK